MSEHKREIIKVTKIENGHYAVVAKDSEGVEYTYNIWRHQRYIGNRLVTRWRTEKIVDGRVFCCSFEDAWDTLREAKHGIRSDKLGLTG